MAQQYIGSKISLISKSDIRYRGILHSIDPAASTVSLEQVRSMGTEGRKSNPSEEIAPTDQLYEFIVFRAADVKDLSIEAPAEPKPEPPKPSVPDDPAIMSTTAPPRAAPNPFMQPNMMTAPPGMYNNTMPPMMYPPGNVPPQWPPYVLPPPGQMHPMMGFPPQPGPPPAQQTNNQSSPSNSQSVTKPSLTSAGKAIPPHQIDSTGSSTNQKASPLATSSPTKPLTSLAANSGPPGSTQPSGLPPKPVTSPNQTRATSGPSDATPSKSVFGASTAMDMMATIAAMNPHPGPVISPANLSAPQKHASSNNASKSTQLSSVHHPGAKTSGNYHPSNNAQALGNGHLTSTPQPSHPQMRHPLPQAPTKSRGGGPKSHGGVLPNHKVNPGGHQPAANPIVPSQDFDFASANAKFNKPAPPNHQAKSEDPNSNQNKDTPDAGSADGLTASDKKSPQNPEDDFVIPEAPPGTYYDKKKSFFDDISSEVKERSAASQDPSKSAGNNGTTSGRGGRGAGRGGRGKGWDRNAERQKNLDTFGEAALHPNLGALGSGYNGYGRGGIHRMGQIGGVMHGNRGMGGRGRSAQGRGNGGAIRGGFGMNPRGGPSGMIPAGINQPSR